MPKELQEKWQSDLESIDGELGGTTERPISSLLIMLETPEEMVVLCTAGKPPSVDILNYLASSPDPFPAFSMSHIDHFS